VRVTVVSTWLERPPPIRSLRNYDVLIAHRNALLNQISSPAVSIWRLARGFLLSEGRLNEKSGSCSGTLWIGFQQWR
jgi:hypothetical protein